MMKKRRGISWILKIMYFGWYNQNLMNNKFIFIEIVIFFFHPEVYC